MAAARVDVMDERASPRSPNSGRGMGAVAGVAIVRRTVGGKGRRREEGPSAAVLPRRRGSAVGREEDAVKPAAAPSSFCERGGKARGASPSSSSRSPPTAASIADASSSSPAGAAPSKTAGVESPPSTRKPGLNTASATAAGGAKAVLGPRRACAAARSAIARAMGPRRTGEGAGLRGAITLLRAATAAAPRSSFSCCRAAASSSAASAAAAAATAAAARGEGMAARTTRAAGAVASATSTAAPSAAPAASAARGLGKASSSSTSSSKCVAPRGAGGCTEERIACMAGRRPSWRAPGPNKRARGRGTCAATVRACGKEGSSEEGSPRGSTAAAEGGGARTHGRNRKERKLSCQRARAVEPTDSAVGRRVQQQRVGCEDGVRQRVPSQAHRPPSAHGCLPQIRVLARGAPNRQKSHAFKSRQQQGRVEGRARGEPPLLTAPWCHERGLSGIG
jgi:hypothetical protein